MPNPASTRLGLVGPVGTDAVASGDDIIRSIVTQLEAVGAGYIVDVIVNRPTAATANKGYVFVATDAGVSFSTGSAWLDVQPLDSDLTAIAALTTTTIGRSLLAAVDAAALRTIAAAGPAVQPAVRAFAATSQTVHNNTALPLALDSERFDTDSMHDTVTSNSRLTCKTAGKYVVTGNVQISSSGTTTGIRQIFIRLNGTTTIGYVAVNQPSATAQEIINVSTIYDLAVTDYVELCAFQTSGGDLSVIAAGNYTPEFAAARIGA